MKAGEIYAQTRTVGELRYRPENLVVIHRIANERVYFERLKPLTYCNTSGDLTIRDFRHMFAFYF